MSENDTPIERAVELLVYAPIGLAMFAKDTVPTFMKMFVARGQTEVAQRRKTAETQAGQYKTIGQMAVKYGGPEVRRQAEAAAGTVRKRAEDTLAAVTAVTTPPPTTLPATTPPGSGTNGSAPTASAPAATKPPARTARTTTTSSTRTSKLKTPKTPLAPNMEAGTGESAAPTTPSPRQDALAIPDYDLLSATQVIDRLIGLARPDLLAVQAYETAHRARTTILGKIAQLSA